MTKEYTPHDFGRATAADFRPADRTRFPNGLPIRWNPALIPDELLETQGWRRLPMHPGVEGRRHLEGQEGFYNALATRLRERGSAFVDISLFLGHAVVEGELEDPVDMQNPGRRSSIEGLLGVIDVEVNGVETWIKLDPASQPEA